MIRHRRAWEAVLFAVLLGVVVRLAYPDDIHYLADEAWSFRHAHSFPAIGMESSRGVRNAGMSVWVFGALAVLGQVTTPAGLTRAVALLALVGHVAVLAIPRWFLPKDEEKDAAGWIWACALSLTNPMLVFLERKIWAQSLLPAFMVVLIIGWLRRDKVWGAFLWGAIGAVIGQIHMAGFFFAPALVTFTFFFSERRKPKWLGWLGGSVVGVLPAIPWLLYLARERPHAAGSSPWLRFRLEFYQYFFSDPTGLTGEYVLGRDVWRAMTWPILGGHPTYLLVVVHVLLLFVSLAIGARAVTDVWERRKNWRSFVRTDTGILLAATLAGMGVLMTLPSISIFRHYMLATFPLQYVWTARAARGSARLLGALCVLTGIVSLGYLDFVRATGGTDEMGKTYRTQKELRIPPEAAK